jgi:UDP-glucuronate 4-epimerase
MFLIKIINIISKKTFLPMQAGDVKNTHANISFLKKEYNFKPKTSIKNGLFKFF